MLLNSGHLGPRTDIGPQLIGDSSGVISFKPGTAYFALMPHLWQGSHLTEVYFTYFSHWNPKNFHSGS
jgi:hypothetical protein